MTCKEIPTKANSKNFPMSIRNLNFLFQPKSVAVIGASERPRSVGATVMRNLLDGGFRGPVMAVNPRHESIFGVTSLPDVRSLGEAPDLAVICTPPVTVPGLIADLGERGTKAAVVLTAGISMGRDADGRSLKEAMLTAAQPHLLRVLGPNCVGLIVPGIGLNASFAHASAAPGKLAFVSQSGGLTTAVLDWAKSRGIGFSYFISLGDSTDVDLGDVLDYLASDPNTGAILLYIESVVHARKLMSAARAAARNKPVIVVKSGRAPEGARAAASHTGALAGADDVYDAAIRRAGMLRVYSTEDLFDAAETLARAKPLRGDRLAIMTNGGGPGVLATDALALSGGRLAELAPDTMAKLNAVLPATWSRGNPVDIIGDATPERYVATARILLADANADALLFIHVPTAIVPSAEIARAVAPDFSQSARTVLTCCLGGDAVAEARRIFGEAGVPTYDTPEDAVRAFRQLVDYRRNQELLTQTPHSLSADPILDTTKAKAIIQVVLASGRNMLSEPEAKAVLAAYGIPIVETRIVANGEEAAAEAKALGFPVALKIHSPDLTHKSDVGGIALNLESPAEVLAAAELMIKRVSALAPNATLDGFTVQQMVRRPTAHELIVGVATDPVFGPVILFGQGGTAVEVIADRAVGLPPLNDVLAGELVSRTRVARLLAGYRDRPAADRVAIERTLVQLAGLVADLPEVLELDINPLLADESGVVALDARIRVAPASAPGLARFAIRPYPKELEETLAWNGSEIMLRPIRPEDEPQHAQFLASISPEDLHLRFFSVVRQVAHSQLARFTQIDYDREMAFVATRKNARGDEETLGVVRAVADPDNLSAEYAILVRTDVKGKGMGSLLMEKLIRYCRARGTGALVGEVLADNQPMLTLARHLGFVIRGLAKADVVEVQLDLTAPTLSASVRLGSIQAGKSCS